MPDKKINNNTSSFLNTVSQFLMGFSPSVSSRAISANLAPAAKSKRRQEYGLNSPAQQTSEPAQQPMSKPVSSSKPSTRKREKVSAVSTSLQQRGIGGKVDFKSKGAISTAAGGSTDYSLGYTPGLIKYKGSNSELGLKADTSGLKAKKPMATEPTKKQMRQARRIERLEKRQEIQRQKGEQALSEGRTMDAKQKRYRYNRLQERIDRNKSKM